jgi:hypothetical protein
MQAFQPCGAVHVNPCVHPREGQESRNQFSILPAGSDSNEPTLGNAIVKGWKDRVLDGGQDNNNPLLSGQYP